MRLVGRCERDVLEHPLVDAGDVDRIRDGLLGAMTPDLRARAWQWSVED